MKKHFFVFGTLLLTLASFLGCSGPEKGPDKSARITLDDHTVVLMVFDLGRTVPTALAGATVVVKNVAGTVVSSGVTDIFGDLPLTNLLGGYTIEVTYTGFYGASLRVMDPSRFDAVRIYLKGKKAPVNNEKRATGFTFIDGALSTDIAIRNLDDTVAPYESDDSAPNGIYNFAVTPVQESVRLEYRKKSGGVIQMLLIKDTVKMDVYLNKSIEDAGDK